MSNIKTALSLIIFWVVSFVVLYVAIYLINAYADGAWYEFLPQDRHQRVGTMGLAGLVLVFGSMGYFLKTKIFAK